MVAQTAWWIEYELIRTYAFGYIIGLVGTFMLICYGQCVLYIWIWLSMTDHLTHTIHPIVYHTYMNYIMNHSTPYEYNIKLIYVTRKITSSIWIGNGYGWRLDAYSSIDISNAFEYNKDLLQIAHLSILWKRFCDTELIKLQEY